MQPFEIEDGQQALPPRPHYVSFYQRMLGRRERHISNTILITSILGLVGFAVLVCYGGHRLYQHYHDHDVAAVRRDVSLVAPISSAVVTPDFGFSTTIVPSLGPRDAEQEYDPERVASAVRASGVMYMPMRFKTASVTDDSLLVVQTPAPGQVRRDAETTGTALMVSSSGGLYVSDTTPTPHLSPLIEPTHVGPARRNATPSAPISAS